MELKFSPQGDAAAQLDFPKMQAPRAAFQWTKTYIGVSRRIYSGRRISSAIVMPGKKSKSVAKKNRRPISDRAKPPKAGIKSSKRWTELTGIKSPPRTGVSRALHAAILSMKAFRAGQAGNAEIYVFARAIKGSGCERRAVIAGWYEKALGPGQACIGEAAVKALLDAAAAKICCEKLGCPSDCPCNYTPQKKLGTYVCDPGVSEQGYLLQETNDWNCHCIPKDIG